MSEEHNTSPRHGDLRVMPKNDFLSTTWRVERRNWFGWKKVVVYSSYVYGDERAHDLAAQTLHQLQNVKRISISALKQCEQ